MQKHYTFSNVFALESLSVNELLQREFSFTCRKINRFYGEYLLIQKLIHRFYPKPKVVQLTLEQGGVEG